MNGSAKLMSFHVDAGYTREGRYPRLRQRNFLRILKHGSQWRACVGISLRGLQRRLGGACIFEVGLEVRVSRRGKEAVVVTCTSTFNDTRSS